ncbi:MAG: ABC transporter ATP-binding protein [Synechococcales cyanobacterium]
MGINGAGKTTTVKMLAGLITPDRGHVWLAGRDPHRDPQAFRVLGAMLEGSRHLYGRLTALENLEYFGVLRGLSPRHARQRGQHWLEQFELTHKAGTTVQTLSRGMQQKVAIAVALVHDPAVLVLDEPTLGLDVPTTALIQTTLRQWVSPGKAMVLTTHQLDVAEAVADHVAVIHQGKLLTQQPLSAFIRPPTESTYRIRVEGLISPDQRTRIETLGGQVIGDPATPEILWTGDPDQLYEVLAQLRPLPLISLTQEQRGLREVFLKLLAAATLPGDGLS